MPPFDLIVFLDVDENLDMRILETEFRNRSLHGNQFRNVVACITVMRGRTRRNHHCVTASTKSAKVILIEIRQGCVISAGRTS